MDEAKSHLSGGTMDERERIGAGNSIALKGTKQKPPLRRDNRRKGKDRSRQWYCPERDEAKSHLSGGTIDERERIGAGNGIALKGTKQKPPLRRDNGRKGKDRSGQ